MARGRFSRLLLGGILCVSLLGCSEKNTDNGSGDNNTSGEQTTAIGNSASSGETVDTGTAGLDETAMFTERDMDSSYDLNGAIKLVLEGESAKSDSASVIIDGSVITITEEAVYVISGSLEDGMIIVDAEGAKLQLVLDGVDINSETSAAIYVKSAEKVFITTADGTENILTSGNEFIAIDDNNIDATIFSKDDITLNGTGTLNILAKSGHGIVSKDDLKITGGVYNIEAGDHGLSGKNSVRIAGGDITISSVEDGIHSENTEEDGLGYVYIQDGNINISAGDDGMHAGYYLIVRDGDINVEGSYEGLEGLVIDISGGNIIVNSSDDGLNAAGGNDASGLWNDAALNGNNDFYGGRGKDDFMGHGGGMNGGGMMDVSAEAGIVISGGEIHVNASGDGLDSNGSLYITGGEIFVNGPTNSGNGALDYGTTACITGGSIIAIGASGMTENFSSAENQGAIMLNVYGDSGDTISVINEAGEELMSWTAGISFQNVIVSCGGIEDGGTYTIKVGDSEQIITMSGLVYGSGMGGQGGHGRPEINNAQDLMP
ncbi:MAG: carbohydrate-binding domain-containing protein [Wujia sp.]